VSHEQKLLRDGHRRLDKDRRVRWHWHQLQRAWRMRHRRPQILANLLPLYAAGEATDPAVRRLASALRTAAEIPDDIAVWPTAEG